MTDLDPYINPSIVLNSYSYMLATELHGHLDDLSGSLMQMIDAVTALSLSNGTSQSQADSGADAMTQIAQILSSHLESLQWIDGAVREVETKVTDVEKRVRGANGEGAGHTGGTWRRGYGLGR